MGEGPAIDEMRAAGCRAFVSLESFYPSPNASLARLLVEVSTRAEELEKLQGLCGKMSVEMHKLECRIAEFKTQLGKSSAKTELDSYKTANSAEIVSMVIHDDLPLNWQHMTADTGTIDSGGYFNAWARM